MIIFINVYKRFQDCKNMTNGNYSAFVRYGSALAVGAVLACSGCDDYSPSNIDLKGAKITEKGLEVYIGKEVRIAKDTGDGKTFKGLNGYIDGWREEEKKAAEEYSKKPTAAAGSDKKAAEPNPHEELKSRIGRLEEKLDEVLKTRASSGPDLTIPEAKPMTPVTRESKK